MNQGSFGVTLRIRYIGCNRGLDKKIMTGVIIIDMAIFTFYVYSSEEFPHTLIEYTEQVMSSTYNVTLQVRYN